MTQFNYIKLTTAIDQYQITTKFHGVLKRLLERNMPMFYFCELALGQFVPFEIPTKYIVAVIELELNKIMVDYPIEQEESSVEEWTLSDLPLDKIFILITDAQKLSAEDHKKLRPEGEHSHWAEKRFQIMGAALLVLAKELQILDSRSKLLSKKKGIKLINASSLAQEIEDLKESFWPGEEKQMSFSKKNFDETIRNSIKTFKNWDVVYPD